MKTKIKKTIQLKEVTALKNSVIKISQFITQRDASFITITKKIEEDPWGPTQVKCVPILQAVQLTTSAFITERIV